MDNKAEADNIKQKGNEAYGKNNYAEAKELYSKAIGNIFILFFRTLSR